MEAEKGKFIKYNQEIDIRRDEYKHVGF